MLLPKNLIKIHGLKIENDTGHIFEITGVAENSGAVY